MTAAWHAGLGLVWGYLLVTIAESLFHRHFRHAGPRLRRVWRRIPVIGAGIAGAHYAHHVVHHGRTYRRDPVTQFRDPEERARLDAELARRGRDDVRRHRYGLTMGISGFAQYLGPLLPPVVATAVLAGPWTLAGMLVPVLAFPCVSAFVHPWLHVPLRVARVEAPWPVRRLVGTSVLRHVARAHYVHHVHPDCNFNLLPGGDFLLGVYRPPSVRDLAQMRRLGIGVRI